jgi:hypothetical protein
VRLFAALPFAVLAALASPARAGFTSADAGTTGAQFLTLGAGARAEGMGQAYTAVSDEADAVYWNPASLTRVKGNSATFMHTALPAGVNYEFMGYGRRLGESGGVGASLQYLSQPGIDQTDSSGFSTGATFRPSDLAASLGFGYTIRKEDLGPLTGASLGVAGKYVRSTITRSAYTYAADIAFLSAPYKIFDRDFRIAYVAQNLGGTLKFQLSPDPLPTTLRLGASLALSEAWTFALDVDEAVGNHPYAAMGTEYRVAVDEDASFSGRLGLNTLALGDAGSFSGAALGLGARFRSVSMDYAFAPMGALGMTHYVSLGCKF